MLVTVRVRPEWRGLRDQALAAAIRQVLRATNDRGLVRVVHFCVIDDHIHLIVEAEDRRALSRGLQGFGTRLARALHRHHGRRGRVLADRHHTRALRTPLEVRNAVAYVVNNARKHGYRLAPGRLDPHSSGPWSNVFVQGLPEALRSARVPSPVVAAETWLLRYGWRRRGLIDVDEVPGQTG